MTGPDDKTRDVKAPPQKAKGEEILQVLKKGTEFTHELLKENERLRFLLAQHDQESESMQKEPDGGDLDAEVVLLQKKLKAAEEEKSSLLKRYKEVEAENLDFANRYLDIENENNVLANLYVASYQLHSTLDFGEVLKIILEIIINLIGAGQFAVFLLDEKTHELTAVDSEGLEDIEVPVMDFSSGPVGHSAETGENYFRQELDLGKDINPNKPMVCIPMKIKERVIGVLAIYTLLQQKDSFTKLDYELFNMLAGHSATAIFSSKLYSESKRKLSTIQGFIDLMIKK